MRALYLTAICLGLRQGEILGLAWEDVDLDQGRLTVHHSLQRYGHAYHLDDPKTLKSRRSVPLPSFLVDELRAHRAQQAQERLLLGPEWRDQWGLVFTSEWGDPLGGTAVTRYFQGLLDKAELPRWRFHDLRHASATFMLARGVSLHTVMLLLGHSTIAMTVNVYGHVAPEVQRDATEQVVAALIEGFKLQTAVKTAVKCGAGGGI